MAVTFNKYDEFVLNVFEGDIDADTDTWEVALMNTTHVFTQTHDRFSNVSANQIATGNGYTQADGAGAGKTLSSVAVTQTGGVMEFDSADVSWSAVGGSIVASDAVVFSGTAVNDLLGWSIDFDGEQTAGAGTTFLITVHDNGWFRI